jgi:hypothetical protein
MCKESCEIKVLKSLPHPALGPPESPGSGWNTEHRSVRLEHSRPHLLLSSQLEVVFKKVKSHANKGGILGMKKDQLAEIKKIRNH